MFSRHSLSRMCSSESLLRPADGSFVLLTSLRVTGTDDRGAVEGGMDNRGGRVGAAVRLELGWRPLSGTNTTDADFLGSVGFESRTRTISLHSDETLVTGADTRCKRARPFASDSLHKSGHIESTV